MAHTPILGYKEQSQVILDFVNQNKIKEEEFLRIYDLLKQNTDMDQRCLALARTYFEIAYMYLNRAALNPDRVKLPGEE